MVTIHLLWHGQALCRFSTEVPGRWPEGHVWVGKNDWQGVKLGKDQRFCAGCVEEAQAEKRP
jgi:hypothetical protein